MSAPGGGWTKLGTVLIALTGIYLAWTFYLAGKLSLPDLGSFPADWERRSDLGPGDWRGRLEPGDVMLVDMQSVEDTHRPFPLGPALMLALGTVAFVFYRLRYRRPRDTTFD